MSVTNGTETAQAYSSSIATKISEIERLNGNTEREKPEGHDRGFLWRMNSYWRYQQVPGGVIVECESMTLSRSIPSFLEYMVRPIINKVARESMHRTLQSMKARILRSYALQAGGLRIIGRVTRPPIAYPSGPGGDGLDQQEGYKAPMATAISRVAMIACSV